MSAQDSEKTSVNSRDITAFVPQNGVRRALLIAAGRHIKKGITPLVGVDPDVDLIRERLLDPHCGFKDENVVVLKTDDYPTLEKIVEALDVFLNSCGKDDFIFLYFGGHGFRDVKTNVDYFIPFDAVPVVEGERIVSFLGTSCFSFGALREKIGACRAKFKWVVVDACRVNFKTRAAGGRDAWKSIGKLEAAKGSLWFQSCGINERSYEKSFISEGKSVNHGLFTWYFCEGARGKAANDDGLISPMGLFNYARDKMSEEHNNDRAIPKQAPLCSCQDLSDAEFVFVDLSDGKKILAKKAYVEALGLVNKGDYSQARAKIDEALEFEPENETFKGWKNQIETLLNGEIRDRIQAHIAQGWKYYAKQDYSEALNEAYNALQLDPLNEEALELKEKAVLPSHKSAPQNVASIPSTKKKDARVELPKKVNDDLRLAAIHAQAGHEAFNKKDYLFAQEEGETALKLNPSSVGAKKLLEKTQVELDNLARLLQEGNSFFDARNYDEAIKKAREIKSLCVNYPKADALENKARTSWLSSALVAGEADLARGDGNAAREHARQALLIDPDNGAAKELEKKAIKSLVDALIAAGEADLVRNDGNAAREKARQAFELIPDDPDAKELEKKAIKALVDALVAAGEADLARDDGNSAREKTRQAFKLIPNDPDAKDLENKAIKSMVDALVADGWEAYGLNDKQGALAKARQAFKLIPDDPAAKELEKKAIKALVDALVADGWKVYERNDKQGALAKARQAFELIPDDPDARELEKKAIKSLVEALVIDGWNAYELNDKQEALAKVRQALKLNPDDEDARKLKKEVAGLDICDGGGVVNEHSVKTSLVFGVVAFVLIVVSCFNLWREDNEQNFPDVVEKPVAVVKPVVVEKPVRVEKLDSDFLQTNAGARAVLKLNGVEVAFRYCPSGTFMMGSPEDEEGRYSWDQEQRSVTISEGFWICETETTQAQWDIVGVKKEEECYFKGAKLPVEDISWNECDAFVKRLNELGTAPDGWRWVLPTEEQWEYACRAGTAGTTYGKSLDECTWYCYNSGKKTHVVGTKQPNDWGIYDMLGNVWEWTSSKYGESSFINRGGSWFNNVQSCRPAKQDDNVRTFCNFCLGFRCVLIRR